VNVSGQRMRMPPWLLLVPSATTCVRRADQQDDGQPRSAPKSKRLQQTQAQVDEVGVLAERIHRQCSDECGRSCRALSTVPPTQVVDIMKMNIDKVLERDQKLSQLDDRADALQEGASQFEKSAGVLKNKMMWKNMKMIIIMVVVGIILFVILIIINFVVITKGAGRIAEVAARFTLDAMPGRQMSIDADLSAGLIDDAEAKRRREEISREEASDMAWQVLQDEWEFNRRAGFSEDGDQMPDCMKQDGIGPAKVVWDVPADLVVQAYQRQGDREQLFKMKASG